MLRDLMFRGAFCLSRSRLPRPGSPAVGLCETAAGESGIWNNTAAAEKLPAAVLSSNPVPPM